MRDLPELTELDAVLCDAGGVLLLPDPQKLRSLLEPCRLAPDDEAVVRAHYVSMRALDRAGHAGYSVGHRAFAESIGAQGEQVDLVADAVAAIYTRHPLVPAPGAAESLQRLSAADVALGVVSNASGTMAQQLAHHQICSTDGPATQVAVVVDSEIVGVEKPNPALVEASALKPRCFK